MIESYYEILGVSQDATRDEIRAAYKARAQREHPDKGGSIERFKLLNEAYRALSDDEKRERYDNGSYNPKAYTIENMAIQRLASMFQQVLLSQDTNLTTDIIVWVSQSLHQSNRELVSKMMMTKKSMEKLDSLESLVKHEGDGIDLFTGVVIGQRDAYRKTLDDLNREHEVTKLALTMLQEYKSCGSGNKFPDNLANYLVGGPETTTGGWI